MILMKNDMLVIYCMAVLRKMIMVVGFSHSLHDTQTGMNTFSASFQSNILPWSINMVGLLDGKVANNPLTSNELAGLPRSAQAQRRHAGANPDAKRPPKIRASRASSLV